MRCDLEFNVEGGQGNFLPWFRKMLLTRNRLCFLTYNPFMSET